MKRIVQIDAVDRRILSVLQIDGSVSNADLAEKVGVSAASCWRRVRSMEESGLLLGAVRLVNAEKARTRRHRALPSTVEIPQREKHGQEFEAFVAQRGEILECHSMSGEWDFQLRIVAADVAEYEAFLMHILLRKPGRGGGLFAIRSAADQIYDRIAGIIAAACPSESATPICVGHLCRRHNEKRGDHRHQQPWQKNPDHAAGPQPGRQQPSPRPPGPGLHPTVQPRRRPPCPGLGRRWVDRRGRRVQQQIARL